MWMAKVAVSLGRWIEVTGVPFVPMGNLKTDTMCRF